MCLNDYDCKPNEECFYSDITLAYDCRCKRGYAKAADGSCQVFKSKFTINRNLPADFTAKSD